MWDLFIFILFTVPLAAHDKVNCTTKAETWCGPSKGGQCGADGDCYCAVDWWHDPEGDTSGGVCVQKPSSYARVGSFCGLSLLLILGKFTRLYMPCVQQLFMPSSVIGGFYGLVIRQIFKGTNHDVYHYLSREWTNGWKELPSFLINLVFAALFLGVEIPKVKTVWDVAGPQLMYGMVVAWGQFVMALLITAAVLIPVWGVNPMMALTIPVGFAGGHGTAAGLASSFETLGYPGGGDVGLATATVGLLSSVLIGMLLVNFAASQGWVKESKLQTDGTSKLSLQGVIDPDNRPAAGFFTVSKDSIDVLAWHLAVIGMAMLIGYGFKQILLQIEASSQFLTDHAFFRGFPLFPLCMVGGIILQKGFQRFDKKLKLVDQALMERVSGTALDYLVVAGIATVNLDSIGDNLPAFLVLCAWGLLWQIFCLLVLARILNFGWGFENGICVFGQSTGVIAVGLMLLRIVDPQSRTPVPQAFSYKQLIHSMFMGGGIWTSLSLPLLNSLGIWPMVGITGAVFLGWILVWALWFRPKYPAMKAEWEKKLAHVPEPVKKKVPDIDLYAVLNWTPSVSINTGGSMIAAASAPAATYSLLHSVEDEVTNFESPAKKDNLHIPISSHTIQSASSTRHGPIT